MAENRQAAKAGIRILAKKFGMKAMLQFGQGEQNIQLPPNVLMSEADKQNITNYYITLLTKKDQEPPTPEDLKNYSVDQLLECLSPDNAVERIAYRRDASTAGHKNLVRIEKGAKGQASMERIPTANDSKIIGFKHKRYEVAESN